VFPLLGLVVFLDLFRAFGDRWTGSAQAVAFIGGVALVVGVFAAANLVRGRRPLQLPDDVGVPEVALYLLLPIAPVVIGADGNPVVAAAVNTLANALLLLVAYVVVRWGIIPMLRWAMIQMVSQLSDVSRLALKSLPLVLLFSAFIFLNAEMWQVANDMTAIAFVSVAALVVSIGGAFVLSAVRRIAFDLEAFDDWREIAALCEGTPAATTVPAAPTTAPPQTRLSRGARSNLTLRLFVALSIQILLVSLLTTAFYVVFGVLTVREATVLQWTTAGELSSAADWAARFDLGGSTYVFSRQLLVVASFIGLFSGLQFTVQVITDPAYRSEFADEMTHDARRALAVRAVYLRAAAPA
jgi:hypothetical protein